MPSTGATRVLQELATLLRATILAAIVEVVLFFALFTPVGIIPYGFPRSLPVLDGLLSMLLVGAMRFAIRLVQSWQTRSEESVLDETRADRGRRRGGRRP